MVDLLAGVRRRMENTLGFLCHQVFKRILDLVRPSHGPLGSRLRRRPRLRRDGWVILALMERMTQVDFCSALLPSSSLC